MGQGGPRRSGGASPKASHPSQQARRRRVAARKLARSARLLVCECDAKARPAIGDVIRNMGYEVTAHHTLADTLREATTGAFDVIVASVPTLSDEKLGLLQVLRRAMPAVPLVIVTSDGSLEMRRRCQSARPFYFAVRPLDEAEVRSVLVGAVEKSGAGA
jgi:DNA-binding NtrC family response regulator